METIPAVIVALLALSWLAGDVLSKARPFTRLSAWVERNIVAEAPEEWDLD